MNCAIFGKIRNSENCRFYRIPLLSAVFASLLMVAVMTISVIGYGVGLTIGVLTLPFAVLLSVVTMLRVFREDDALALGLGIAVSLGSLLLFAMLAGQLYDFSFDGNWYHKVAIKALADGWNPLRSHSLESWDSDSALVRYTSGSSLWADHYPHGLWELHAALYCVTGNIECSKAWNLYSAVSMGMALWFCLRRWGLSRKLSTVASALSAVNPITMAQYSTFYCDAFLMTELFTLILALVMLSVPDLADGSAAPLLLVFSAFAICSNVKFTGLAYSGVFVLSFCVLYAYKHWKKDPRFGARNLIVLAVAFLSMLFFSVFVLGCTSYCSNFADHGNPLYPLLGEGRVDIMTANSPRVFEDATTLEKLFLSYFSECANMVAASEEVPCLKIPFTWTSAEMEMLGAYDLRISGFGVLYGGILLTSIPLAGLVLLSSSKAEPSFFCSFVAFLVPSLCLTFLLSDSWWARYSTYVYAVNIFILVYLFRMKDALLIRRNLAETGDTAFSSDRKRARAISWAFSIGYACLLAVNTIFFVNNSVVGCFEESIATREVVDSVKKRVDEGGCIIVATSGFDVGWLLALEDADVGFELAGSDSLAESDGLIGSLEYAFVRKPFAGLFPCDG